MYTIWTPWGVFQVHFCADELVMLMAFMGMSGGLMAWVRSKFKRHVKAEQESHHNCCHPNDEHPKPKE